MFFAFYFRLDPEPWEKLTKRFEKEGMEIYDKTDDLGALCKGDRTDEIRVWLNRNKNVNFKKLFTVNFIEKKNRHFFGKFEQKFLPQKKGGHSLVGIHPGGLS